MSEESERLQELLAREQIDHARTRERAERLDKQVRQLRRQLSGGAVARDLPAEEPPPPITPAEVDRDPSRLPWPALTPAERRERLGI
jgi:hypothetical protein